MSPHVLVFGDVMLDMQVSGSVRRMSPEAPNAPVLLATETRWRPGGAANVAANVTAMGGRASLVGGLGCDADGFLLANLMRAEVEDSVYLARQEVRTTTKIRVIADGRQMMRVDCESPEPLTAHEIEQALPGLIEGAGRVQAVVISDYAKGMVAPKLAAALIAAARAHNLPVVVDSKSPAAAHFHGAGVLKPNCAEIAIALERPEPVTDDDAAACAMMLWQACRSTFVLLTRGASGLCLAGQPGVLHIPAHPVTAIDVTGAGDAVAAGLALSLARGDSIDVAARFANAAGAVVVTQRGTGGPTPEKIGFFYDPNNCEPCQARDRVAGERAEARLN